MLFKFVRELLIDAFAGEGQPRSKKPQPTVYLHQHPRVTLAMLKSLESGDAARAQLVAQRAIKP